MKDGSTRYLGLDAHKATITVAIGEASGPPALYGTIANDPSAVGKLIRQLGRAATLVAAYEAGPTGYALHRQLTALGVECVVVAPSLIPRTGGRSGQDRQPGRDHPGPPAALGRSHRGMGPRGGRRGLARSGAGPL